MTAVRERCGLTQRYFYEHFRSRDDLLGALFDTTFGAMFDQVQTRVADAAPDLVEIARAAVSAAVDFFSADRGKARLWIEAIGDPAIAAQKAKSVRALTELAVTQAEAIRGPFSPAQRTRVVLAALIVIGGQTETTTELLAGHVDLLRDEYIDQLAHLFALAVEDALVRGRED